MFICFDYQLLFMECPPYATMLCFFSSFEKYKIKYLLLASKKDTKKHDSCNATNPVSRHCMENAMYVLLFEANQVKNYFKQSMQFLRHTNFTFQKLAKKGRFEEAAEHMLAAMGGNISNPICGENLTTTEEREIQQRDLDLQMKNYTQLANCSVAIIEACTVSKNCIMKPH